MLITTNSQHACCNERESEQHCSTPILSINEFTTTAIEILQANIGHMYRDSAITFGRAGRGDAVVTMDIHSPELAGMNFFGVESAGSRRSPRTKSTVLASDAHAPLGINHLDVAPTERDLLPGIDNTNSVVAENNFGFQVDEIDESVYGDGPSNCCSQSTGQNRRPYEEASEYQGADPQSNSSLGSKNLALAHSSIFSQRLPRTDGQVA